MGGRSESESGNNEAKNTIMLTMIMTASKYRTPAVRRQSFMPAILGLISLVCFGVINWQKNGGRKN